MLSKRVFISKPLHELTSLQNQLWESGIEIVAHSFLAFHPTEFELKQSPDIIFFGSVRSVIFLRSHIDIGNAKDLACIGAKTAELLTEMGFTPSFVGTESGSPEEVAEAFKAWCNGRHVLFPTSDRSLKTISGRFSVDQKEEIVVYKTVVTTTDISACDVYVFSSPSNVEGYFEQNVLPPNSDVIAWGKSTKKALETRGIKVNYTLIHSTLEELTEYLT
jgi:hydroxymethylbilane synthase